MLWKAVVVAPDEPHASSPNRAEVPAVVSATVVERSITGSPLYASRARASISSSQVTLTGILSPHFRRATPRSVPPCTGRAEFPSLPTVKYRGASGTHFLTSTSRLAGG